MMKIPYEQIVEVRLMKDEIDKTRTTRISKWFYNKGYRFQCRPILNRLEESTKKINYIGPNDLINFAVLAYQTFVPGTDISATAKSCSFDDMRCDIQFKSLGVSVSTTSAKGDTIHLTEHSDKRDVHREVVSLNTGIEPGRSIYNAMIDYISKYLKGE